VPLPQCVDHRVFHEASLGNTTDRFGARSPGKDHLRHLPTYLRWHWLDVGSHASTMLEKTNISSLCQHNVMIS
jgi:hypothetical protein